MRIPMRISTTTLESFRLYCTGEWMSFEAMVATATGTVEWNEKMLVGSAFEAAVNEADTDLEIPLDPVGVLRVRTILPYLRTPQVKIVGEVAGHDLVGVADYLVGNEIRDLKCTHRAIDPERYAHSLQWQVYLLLFGSDTFWYDVVHVANRRDMWVVKDIQSFSLRPYPDMPATIERWVLEYADWYKEHIGEARPMQV